jgi:hypothetical protein
MDTAAPTPVNSVFHNDEIRRYYSRLYGTWGQPSALVAGKFPL